MKKNKNDVMIAQERRDYMKSWRAANKDKVKKHNANYWRRRVEKKLAEQENQNGKSREVSN